LCAAYELPPAPKEHHCFGFTDCSGGSNDSFALGVAHAEGNIAVLDCIREVKPPYSPQSVVSEFARTLKSYGISEVSGDGYSGQFVRELFRNQGIAYTVSKRTKSEIYIDLLPALNSGRIELLDDVKLIAQLIGLERKPGRGRDVIDHAPHSHDDLINVAAGVLTLAALQPAQMTFHAPILGPSRGAHAAEYARGILADRSPGLPGVASEFFGDCEKPGGWSHGKGPAAGFDAQFSWSIFGAHKNRVPSRPAWLTGQAKIYIGFVGAGTDPRCAWLLGPCIGERPFWDRAPGETLEQFKRRIAAGLEAFGVSEIVWPEIATEEV